MLLLCYCLLVQAKKPRRDLRMKKESYGTSKGGHFRGNNFNTGQTGNDKGVE